MNLYGCQLAAGFGRLTRLPLGRWLPSPDMVDEAASVWTYPVVGACIGALAGLVYALASDIGMTPALAACWTLIAGVLLTGGLHEDGLADTADGLGGGATPSRKLAIMRDSRIGTYGALALVFSLAVRGCAIMAIAHPGSVVVSLIVSGMLGRTAMVVVLRRTMPARAEGQAASLGTIGRIPARVGGAIAAFGTWVLMPFSTAFLLTVIAGLIGALWARFIRRAIGGYTGDTLGAVEVITECVVLTMIAIRLFRA
ncbi:MAG: adenosylcobinamide-GDP ribazoletransferase [Acidiphilium sp.]|nr:adenosylcobinamide-GDP ribazoletransferase [Acidiphilium sp.]MDD4935572.1 adenosylcobinamide-GDP ribazoletransferase [Acidiphilium sp.]